MLLVIAVFCIGINMDKLNVNFKDYSHFSITELEKNPIQ